MKFKCTKVFYVLGYFKVFCGKDPVKKKSRKEPETKGRIYNNCKFFKGKTYRKRGARKSLRS